MSVSGNASPGVIIETTQITCQLITSIKVGLFFPVKRVRGQNSCEYFVFLVVQQITVASEEVVGAMVSPP